MAETTLESYTAAFKPALDGNHYLSTYYQETDEATYEINTQHMHDAIKCLQKHNVSGMKVLDVGCGPLPMNGLMMSEFFEDIYLSDYNDGMLAPIRKWIKNEPVEYEYSFIINYISKQLKLQPKDLVANTRKKIKEVIHCDIHSENVVESHKYNNFDCVVTRFCVDSCSPDLQSYQKAIKNIIKLIKPNGYFLQMGFFNEDKEDEKKGFWNIGNTRFDDIRLSKESIIASIQQSEGIEILDWLERIHQRNEENTFENTSTFTVLARKK